MNKLVLASRNAHKIEEMQNMLGKVGIKVLSALDFQHVEEVHHITEVSCKARQL